MTRKRKNVEEAVKEEPQARQEGDEQPRRTFPKKGRNEHNDWNTDDYSESRENGPEYAERPNEEEKAQFPTELVAYLRNFVDLINSEGKLDEEVYDKVMEECKDAVEVLLSFYDSCKVVEQIFGSSGYAANLFLKAVFRMKHKKLVDLFFSNSGARTIEKLLIAIAPIWNVDQLQILSTLTDLLCDNWNDVVTCQPSSFLVRCLAKLCCGMTQGSEMTSKMGKTTAVEAGFAKNAVGSQLKALFSRIADLATDTSMTSELLENQHCSLVVNDILDCDIAVETGKCNQFIKKRMDQSADQVVSSLCGKGNSRIWDKAVTGCPETRRTALWENVLQSNLEKLAMNRMSNHPLQNFVKSISTEALATPVCEAFVPFIPDLLQNQRVGVVTAVLKCSRHNLDIQEKLIKELRSHFNASKASQKTDFFLNVLTLNTWMGKEFNVSKVDLQGSLMLQTLFELSKVKSVCAGVMELSKDAVLQMAFNKTCTFVIQAILKSETVENEVKSHLISQFEGSWEQLIENPVGSRVFDVIWDSPLTTVDKKQNILKKLAAVRNTSKNWKFAMLRCDMMLFRKDRKAWCQKMKAWGK